MRLGQGAYAASMVTFRYHATNTILASPPESRSAGRRAREAPWRVVNIFTPMLEHARGWRETPFSS